MDLRGHDDDSDGDDFLPQHRRLGLGRLYQEGELGAIPPSSSSSAVAATPSSLNYNHSGILASGSAFRRPPLFPSPLSSSTQLPPSAATPPSSHRHPQQQQHGGGGGRGGGGSATEAGDNSHSRPPPVQLPSSLDPKLSLLVDRPESHHHHNQQQQQQQVETRKDHPDAAATPRASPTPAATPSAEGVGGSSSTPRTEAAAALTPTKTRPPSAVGAGATSVRYRECLRNHAARVGGHVLDGCGEFMPGGEEGTPEALKCAACTCHRSFHRKEVEGGEEAEALFLPVSSASPPRGPSHGNPRRYYLPGGAGNGAYPGVSGMGSSGARGLHNPPPLSLQTPPTHGRHHHHAPVSMLPAPSSGAGAYAPRSGVMTFGGGGGGNDDEENTNYSGGTTTTESSSEEMQAHMLAAAGTTSFHYGAPPNQVLQTPPMAAGAGAPPQQLQQQYQVVGSSGSTKKRFRSRFTAEQKEMMAGFAEQVGWRMQKQDEAAVEQFCRTAGVSRQVFKVWMHNNKHALLKSKQPQPQPQPQQPQLTPQEQQPQQQQRQSSSSS